MLLFWWWTKIMYTSCKWAGTYSSPDSCGLLFNYILNIAVHTHRLGSGTLMMVNRYKMDINKYNILKITAESYLVWLYGHGA